MKFSLIAVLLVATLASESDAFFFPRFGPFGPFGFRRFGMFGFRRFGLGLPIPMPVPVPVPMPVPFGKRSVENMTAVAEPMTTCNLSTEDLEMKCMGVEYNFECKVENKLNMDHMEKELETLMILPTDFNRMKNETINEAVLLSYKPKDEMRFNNFSMKHDTEELTFKIFQEDKETQGFRIPEKACWDKFEKMMNDEDQVEMKLQLKF